MKVVAINGSSRLDGNTATVEQAVLEELEAQGVETELVQLADKDIRPCRACFACGGKGTCVGQVDNFAEVFSAMAQADGMVLGSPSYSADMSARMKALLERAAVVADMNPGLFDRKVGASISVARRAGSLAAIEAMNRFFLNHGMYVVGSTYWSVAYGQLPGDVADDTEGMETMRNLGRNMAHVIKALNAARV